MIREMGHEDVSQVHALGVEAEGFHTSEQEAEESPFRPVDCLHDWVDADDLTIVDVVDGEVRGFLLSMHHEPTDQLTVNNVYVREGYRRQGIASRLLEECLDRTDPRYVVAHTKPGNIATRELFASHGFREGDEFLWMERYP